MALNETSKEFISLKKLQGKAHTSNIKDLANEALSSGLTVSAKTVFSSDIPASPTATQYTISGGSVQFVRLSASFILGSDTVNGRHAFELKLPDDFESPAGATNNLSGLGTGFFVNGQSINTTKGAIQLVPPSYGVSYEAKPYKFVDGSGNAEQLIPVLDARDWYIDYFNGILFQQDPPGTGDHDDNPRFVDAYIYVGDFVSDSLSNVGSGDGDSGAQYVVLAATGSLTNERVLTPGVGLDLVDAGAGGNVTLNVDISEFASGSINYAEDTIVFVDEDDTNRKETIANFMSGTAGDGLTSSLGVLSVATGTGLEIDSDTVRISAAAAGDGLIGGGGSALSVNVDDSSLEVNADVVQIKDSGVTLAKLSDLANMTVIGNVSGGSATPTAITILDEDNMASNSATALATQQSIKAYVDSVAQGLDPKDSVVAASTSSFTMASTASSTTLVLADGEGGFDSTANTLTIDGVSLSEGDRILIKDGVNSNSAGVDGKWNGIYEVGSLTGTDLTLTRTDDADQDSLSGGAHVFVEQGTVNGDTGYVCTNDGSITIGTTAITWSQFSGPGVFSAGDGLDLTGKVFSLDLKSAGGLKIDTTELAIEPSDFAGAGLEDDGSDNLRLNIAGLTSDSNAGNLSDSIAISDASDSDLTKKITLTELKSVVANFTAGDGLDLNADVFSLDLKASGGLTIDATELAIDETIVPTLSNNNIFTGDMTVTGDLFISGTVSDLVASGTAKFTDGISGSIHHTSDGLSYLVAGTNISIASASNGQITISSSGVGQIGSAEDGDYTDGLFTDFTTSTPIGTPVDRFNEVLKLLVPAPAPDLDNVDSNNSDGASGDLSFGASNDQSSATPAYISVAGTAGFGIAVDVDGLYEASGSAENLRRGIYDGTATQTGDLNEDVAANITSPSSQTNYPANSFGDADVGSLVLEVNGSDLYTLDLTDSNTGTGAPGSGTGSHVNGNGSGFTHVSVATAGTFDSGQTFAQFKHRTGRWAVGASDQRNGWNYIRVKHDKGGGSIITTNYVEWVNDTNSDALTASSNSLDFTGSGSTQLSGVTYHTGGNARYQVTVSNAYKYTYDKDTDHTFTTSNAGTRSNVSYSISPITPADVGLDDHDKQIVVDDTSAVTADYILGGSITASINVAHPIKSDLSEGGESTASGILLYNVTDTATVTSEPFTSETYRLQVDTFTDQTDVTGGTLDWDSSVSLAGSDTGHNTGLQVFRERLYSPLNTGVYSGDFRNTSDGGSLDSGPSGNPDYSAISGTRTYYRKFQNTGSSVRDFSYTLNGSATLVGASDGLGNAQNNFRLSFKMPSDGSGNSTGWLDARNAFTFGNTSDGDGGAIGTVDNSANMTNNISFGTVEIGTNEFIVARIEADDSWTGYLDSLSVSFGAVGSVASSPNVNDIDANQSGVDANLSFGDTLTKTGYATVETTAGGTERNANDLFSLSGDRRGVFDGSTDITGEINETTSASGNSYPANAFGSGVANTGTLKLEVNGTVIHSVDLSVFTSGNSLTGDSGFINMSAALNGQDGSGLPDFTKWYRTGSYKVASADQRNGHNYARVIHTIGATDHESTYVEWVNDNDSSVVSLTSVAYGEFAETGTSFNLSGVTYFESVSGKFFMTAENLYKYVYSDENNAISYPTSTNCSVTRIDANGSGVANAVTNSSFASLPLLSTSVANAHDEDLLITGSFSVSSTTSLPVDSPQTVTMVGRVHHPLKGNTDTASTQSNTLLIYSPSDNSTNTFESFQSESKRLQAATYSQQSDVTSSSNAWDSTVSLNDGTDTGHNTGLMVYNGELISPQEAGNSGDFRNIADGGTLIAPDGNPDYGTLTNSTREYIRWFRNTEGAARQMFTIAINGSGTIVSNSTSLTGDKLQVNFKIPSSNSAQTTGWMDIAVSYATDQVSDDDGCFDDGAGTFDSSLNASNTGTFGSRFVNNNEYILIRVKADKTWTGNITQMTLSWRTA